jgi:hypothetical protein
LYIASGMTQQQARGQGLGDDSRNDAIWFKIVAENSGRLSLGECSQRRTEQF